MSSKPSAPPRSDRPPSFNKERDEFIQTFFSKGARFTQELLRENEILNQQIAELESENAAMRLQIKSDQAIRELLTKIQQLEQEKAQLVSEVHEVEAKSSAVEMTYTEVETELANLASLYVASRQLHSTMNVSSAVRQVKEILEQLVGARSYAIFFLSDDATGLVRIASRDLEEDALPRVDLHTGSIGKVFSTGTADIAEDGNLSKCTTSSPAACIPLRIADRVVGVIAIIATLEQKTRFLPVDYEFFKLLSGHAASAIVAARLFADADRQVPGIETFLEHGV
jgi:vacuolar-type H+-ATPase subunit I/STV1